MKKTRLLILIQVLMTGLVAGQTIQITSPKSGKVWKQGTKYTITWSKTGRLDTGVKIRLFDSTATKKIFNISDGTSNNGSFPWTIPDSVKPGKYKIRVKTLNNKVFDDSDVFTIAPPGGSLPSIVPDNKITKGKIYELKAKPQIKQVQLKPRITEFKPVKPAVSKGDLATLTYSFQMGEMITVTNRTTGKKLVDFKESPTGRITQRWCSENLLVDSRYELLITNQHGSALAECRVKIDREFKIHSFTADPTYPGSWHIFLRWKFSGAKNAWIQEVYGNVYKKELLKNYVYQYTTADSFTDLTIRHPSKFVLYIQNEKNDILLKEVYYPGPEKMWPQFIETYKIAQNWRIDAMHIDIDLKVVGAKRIHIYEVYKNGSVRKLVFKRDFDDHKSFIFSEKPFHKREHKLGDAEYLLQVTWWNGQSVDRYPDKF